MSTKIIKLNRGDSHKFTVNPLIELTETEVVYFALMYPHQPFEKAILLQGYTFEDQAEDGSITIKLTPNDTRPLMPGVYYYTVKLQRGGTLDIIDDFDDATEVKTLIERTKFIVNE